jgi:hypothetical protein
MPFPKRSHQRAKPLNIGPSRSIGFEPLEARRLLAVFSANNVGSLIADINTANTNGDASNTINLAAGIYSLSAATGELLIQNTTSQVKTLSIIGAGPDQTKIDGAGATRVMEIEGSASTMNVVLESLALNNGLASDAGHAGVTAAIGGGLLIDGGQQPRRRIRRRRRCARHH